MCRLLALPVKLLTDTATLPRRGSELAVGYDLSADLSAGDWRRSGISLRLPPGKRERVSTGVAVAVPVGYYGRVAPRSGLAYKHGIDVLAGVVDPDYRGEVFVILQNNGEEEFAVRHGDRIAQLILERVETPEVERVSELPDTARGSAGFGSTGVT